jgi:epoxyqueuosine reductase
MNMDLKTSDQPFEEHNAYLTAHPDEYGWADATGLQLLDGTDPKNILPEAKTIIVLIDVYFKASFPPVMESHFGRCYLDDDRVTKDALARRIGAFRGFPRDNGINSKVPYNLPHRAAAVRAGLGTLGKNGLFYSRQAARQRSWNLPITI